MKLFKHSDKWVSNMTPFTITSMQAAAATEPLSGLMGAIQKTIVSGPVIFDTDNPLGWADLTVIDLARLIRDIGLGTRQSLD